MNGLLHRSETFTGRETRVGEFRLRPISRASALLSDILPIGFSWYRPVAVEVQDGEGTTTQLLVRDPTRLLQVFFYGIAAFALLGILVSGRDK